MYKYLVYISAFFCMVACGSDFEKTATGLHFKVNKKGLGNKPKDGQIVLLNLLYKIDKGDTLFSTREQNFPAVIQYYDSAYQKDGGFMELIGMIKEGDSMSPFQLGKNSRKRPVDFTSASLSSIWIFVSNDY